MPCLHEHLQTFGERPNTRKEPFCMPSMQNERNPSGWSGLRACKRDSTRSFHHTCLRAAAHGHKYDENSEIRKHDSFPVSLKMTENK